MIVGVGTPLRRFDHADFVPAELAAARGGLRVSVCLPARDEESTVGNIVGAVVEALTLRGGGVDLVTDIVVVDDGSTDSTAAAARDAGARVIGSSGQGKGEAMTVALAEADGDVIVFLDADVKNFGPHFVTGLVGPLLGDEDVALVKGFYERTLYDEPNGGGRVTELVARPLISELFAHLEDVRQPLAGETAAPRSVLEKCGFAPGYGVELGLLIDVAERFGTEAICQVDLGVRSHRNRPLSQLRHQAADVLRAALARADLS